MSHFGPPDSIRRLVGRPLFRGGGPGPDFPSRPHGQEGPFTRLARLSHRGREGRPLLHETLLLGSRNALHTTEHAETQKITLWRPRPGDPLTMSHFGPPDSIRRLVGRLLSRGGACPRFSEPATRAGRAFSHRGCLGEAAFARNASVRL